MEHMSDLLTVPPKSDPAAKKTVLPIVSRGKKP